MKNVREGKLKNLFDTFTEAERLTAIYSFGLYGCKVSTLEEITTILKEKKLIDSNRHWQHANRIKQKINKKILVYLKENNIHISRLTKNMKIQELVYSQVGERIKNKKKFEKYKILYSQGKSNKEINILLGLSRNQATRFQEKLEEPLKEKLTNEEFEKKWKTN